MMSKIRLMILTVWICISYTVSGQTSIPTEMDLTSVDAFFSMVEKISSGNEPKEEEWEKLFRTNGYKIYYPEEETKQKLKEILLLAFSPDKLSERDSILSMTMEEVYVDMSTYMSYTILKNYMDMQEHGEELIRLRNTYDFSHMIPKIINRLTDFLYEPVDSLLSFSSFSLLCYELDGHSRGKNILLDFNLFYKNTEEENIGFFAHELFHSYRYNYHGEELTNWLNSNRFLFAIDRLNDETVADLIDKDDVPGYFRKIGVSEAIIEQYEKSYPDTPALLERLDHMTLSFIKGEMSEEEFYDTLDGYFTMGGHPNGLYMANVIRNAGYIEDIIRYFYSPFEFLRIYNKAAQKENEYVFSDSFMEFLDTLEKEQPGLVIKH